MATAFAPRAPATMTSRVVVMMTPGDKRSLEDRARAAAMTPSEFCRLAIGRYDPRVDEAVLETFLSQFADNNRAMSNKLRETNDRLDATLTRIEAKQLAGEAEIARLRSEYAVA